MDDARATAHPQYAFHQLEHALRTASSHPSGKTRDRARAKVAQWEAVLAGMSSGRLTVGSRTPVADTPAWVTLEVAHGGFATGNYLAEAPLREDEQERLTTLPPDAIGTTERERLNLWYLSDTGLAKLRDAVRVGSYRVELPEDSALLAVAWLLDNDQPELALDVVAQLRPLMHQLRFTPQLQTRPVADGSSVHVETVGAVKDRLASATVNRQVGSMRETLQVWHPLYDRLVALWCDTVDGPLPRLSADGVTGGWPCRTWPGDWTQRRQRWLADYDRAASQHGLSRAHAHPKSNFARLHSALLRCEKDARALGARNVGWIRRALANTISKHGAPTSDQRTALRETQAAITWQPTHAAVAHLLADRLDRYPRDGGLPALDPVVQDVTEQDASGDVPAGTGMPAHLVAKIRRALDAPIGDLVEMGVITSGDVLAKVLPQITGQAIAAGFDDPALAALYAQSYAAFRRRRSLLLLNLEHQVQFDELPWIAALDQVKTATSESGRSAHHTLSQAVLLALNAFPHAVLPNPLVREFGALAERAQVSVPLVEEVAADIFMGTFTDKWRRAAAITSETMAGTLYARYFNLPDAADWSKPPRRRVSPRRWGKQVAADFAEVCTTRAEEAGTSERASFVAHNGAILEQCQILTTHNLATLVNALDLDDKLRELAPDLAQRTFAWAIRRQRQPSQDHHAALVMMKNVAYAWRQALFYLSFCDHTTQSSIVHQLRDQITGDEPARLDQAINGLQHVLNGGHFSDTGHTDNGGRRLLGWSTGPHWCLAGQNKPA